MSSSQSPFLSSSQGLGRTVVGRSLFATEYVPAGEVLFEEEPLVCAQFNWNAYCSFDACEYCLRSLETAEQNAQRLTRQPALVLPHPECCETQPLQQVICEQCGTRYCSEKCKSLAREKYHRVICEGCNRERTGHPLQILENTWRNMHHPPETTSINLIIRLLAMLQQADDKGELVSKLSVFCSKSRDEETNSIHKLLGDQFAEGLKLLQEMVSDIFGDSVGDWVTPDGFKSLFAMIGRNGQGIGTSSLSVWVSNCDALDLPESTRRQLDEFIDHVYSTINDVDSKFIDEDGNEQDSNADVFLNCEGSGLYVQQSAANHSCQPNAEISFPYNNSVLRFTATQDIPAGQEVFISYMDECMLGRSRHSRQKYLKENYLFECQCERCELQVDEPDVTSDEEDTEDDYLEEDSMG